MAISAISNDIEAKELTNIISALYREVLTK